MTATEILAEGAAQIGVVIDPSAARKFEQYSQLLVKWASKINLTSITDQREIATRHFIDSLTILRRISAGCSVIDIGAGAGLPGIPLKICRPSISLTLADSREKKVFFMKEAIRKLGLKKTRAVKARAGIENEKTGTDFDIAVSRAVAAPDAARAAAGLVKKGGSLILMKGKNGLRQWEQEKNLIPAGCEQAGAPEKITLPISGEIRFIIALKKTGEEKK